MSSGKGIINQAKRYSQILGIFARYGFKDVLDRLGLGRDYGEEYVGEPPQNIKDRQRWERVRLALEELGPTFIKFGQFMSNRPDLLPAEFIRELEKLQDAVKSMTYEEMAQVIEEEFEMLPEELFTRFDRKPLASASMAQVHLALLPNNAEVAVKVQRPNIKALIETDIEIMRRLGREMEKRMEEAKYFKPVNLINYFEKSIHEEMDFNNEGLNIKRFRKHMAEEEGLLVPIVYPKYSSERVLTMQYVQGTKVSELYRLQELGMNGKELARRFARLFFIQVFDHGFFHADPHPGNVIILNDNRICFLDFGMMGTILTNDRELLASIFIGIVQKDVKRLIRDLKEFSIEAKIEDERKLSYELHDLVEQFDMLELEEVNMNVLVARLRRIIITHQIEVPPDFFLFMRAMAIMEGICRKLDPTFNIIDEMRPLLQELFRLRIKPEKWGKQISIIAYDVAKMAKKLPYDLQDIMEKVKQGELHVQFEHQGLEKLDSTIQKTTNRVVLAIILAALVIGSSLIILAGTPPRFNDIPIIGLIGFVLAGIIGLWLIYRILRSKQI